MKIHVMLKDGEERTVGKDELQCLLSANQVIIFERSDGLVFVGYDKMRGLGSPYTGEERRSDESLVAAV